MLTAEERSVGRLILLAVRRCVDGSRMMRRAQAQALCRVQLHPLLHPLLHPACAPTLASRQT